MPNIIWMHESEIARLREITEREAPKNRNILMRMASNSGDGKGNWKITGFKWVECSWRKDMSGLTEKFCVWTGDKRSHTTEPCVPIAWAELPNA